MGNLIEIEMGALTENSEVLSMNGSWCGGEQESFPGSSNSMSQGLGVVSWYPEKLKVWWPVRSGRKEIIKI